MSAHCSLTFCHAEYRNCSKRIVSTPQSEIYIASWLKIEGRAAGLLHQENDIRSKVLTKSCNLNHPESGRHVVLFFILMSLRLHSTTFMWTTSVLELKLQQKLNNSVNSYVRWQLSEIGQPALIISANSYPKTSLVTTLHQTYSHPSTSLFIIGDTYPIITKLHTLNISSYFDPHFMMDHIDKHDHT